ncbi:MAG: polysaccharide biosynthesis tyrosine autokinase [Acidobacteriaceae bacterium]|nr:polysaccharide biosynthesis tyrosine autokinase [Acidobacteriaceae bacterium]MBV9764455.1 polysaccharide biosynthesis tyrosine autokinase [Acidobacteriaceae bacterium]
MFEQQQQMVKLESPQQHAYPASASEVMMRKYTAVASYMDVLLTHIWLILSVACVVTTLVAIYSFRIQPVYRATASMEIESETPLIQSLTDLFRADSSIDDETFLSTQVDVVQSDNIAWRTIEQLGLAKEPEYAGVAREPGSKTPGMQHTPLVNAFKSHLMVERQRDTRMMRVHFDSIDPQLAARVANAIVENYIEYSFRLKYDATRQATAWLEQQLGDLKNKVEKSQQALVDYEVKNSMVGAGDKGGVAEQNLGDLSRDFTAAQDERVRRQSLANMVNADPSRIRYVAQSPILQKLEESEAELRTQYADASQAYGPTFPKVKRLQAQLDEARDLIAAEQKRITDSINNDYATARSREALLGEAVAKQKSEVAKMNELSIEHNLLKHDFESNQALYDSLMQRMKDATVSAGLRATNIHMIDRAFPPSEPYRPKKARNIVIGATGGLILGLLLAAIREAMDNSIKGAEEVEMLSGLPALAMVPAADVRKFLDIRGQGQIPIDGVATALIHYPESALAESIRVLRTSILLSQADRSTQVLLITSPSPSEGKTSTSVNLAIALAQKSGQVLLLDSDFRRPGGARSLGLRNQPGLSEVLTGTATVDEAIVPYSELPELSVMPAGSRPTNPAELLSSPAMENLLRDLRGRFTSIVIDSPPVLLITDTTILASMVDGIIMVVQSASTTRGALVRSFRVLNLIGARVLGSVLNKVDVRRDGYYGHYNYYSYLPKSKYYSNEYTKSS